MPKISDERRAERRMQIIQAAWACFERKGPHATTMDDIIKASDLSAGAVYSYFKSKDDLIVAAHEVALEGFGAEVRELFLQRPLPPPDVFISEFLKRLVAYSERNGMDRKRNTVFVWGEALRNPRLHQALRTNYSVFRAQIVNAAADWKREGVLMPDAEAADIAKTLLTLALGFVTQSVIMGDIEPATIGRAMQSLHSTQGASISISRTGSIAPNAKARKPAKSDAELKLSARRTSA